MARRRMSAGRDATWKWVLLVVVATVAIVGAAVGLTGNHASSRPRTAGEVAAAKSLDAAPTTTAPAVHAAFLGDSYTYGLGGGGYVKKTAADMGWQPAVFGQIGTGYTSAGSDPGLSVYEKRLPTVVAAQPQVVVVQGSPNDSGVAIKYPGQIKAAAAQLYTELKAELPAARIIVVGPTLVPSKDPVAVKAVRDELATATAQAQLPFIDPVALNWLSDPSEYGPDKLHPTAAGYAEFSRDLVSQLRTVLG